MKVGDKIKSFEIKKIVDSISYNYDDKGRKTKYNTKFMFLLSDKGQERILEYGKTNLNECEVYFPTFSDVSKFKTWNQF